MRNNTASWFLLGSALVLVAAACGDDDASEPVVDATGGTGATGGTAGTGGSGGGSGTGGTGTAGTAGSAGTAGTAGTAGSAGAAGTAGAAGSAGAAGASGASASFVMHEVDNAADGPAFAAIEDVNNDGKLDVVIAAFGQAGFGVPNGEVRAYLQGDDLGAWTKQVLMPKTAGYKWPNGITFEDIDRDGDNDLFVPLGFLVCDAIPLAGPCGALIWLENTGANWTVHEIVPHGNALFFHHVEFVDIDDDGIRDAVTVGERKPTMGASVARAMWFKGNTTADRFDKTPIQIGDGLGSIPSAYDLDGDGDLDLLGAEYFLPNAASFAWMENPGDPTQPFTRHVIANDAGLSIQLSLVPNLYGDGVLRAIGANHTNTADSVNDAESAVYVLDVPGPSAVATAGAWPKVKISEGIVSDRSPLLGKMGAPGIFGYGDIDGDGDIDVLVSGDGDPRVFWLEQRGPGQFATHVLIDSFKQAGGMKVVDLNGDGTNELVVTGYENNAVRIYERQ